MARRRVYLWVEGDRCLFGRHHTWQGALTAAVNANEGAELPDPPKWIWWCPVCNAVGPWAYENQTSEVEA